MNVQRQIFQCKKIANVPKIAKKGMKFKNNTNNISIFEQKISNWLGKETKMIKNKAGDPVFFQKIKQEG